MPLFRCDQCGVIENTALGEYWGIPPGKRRCSECATGTWHGRWEKRTALRPGEEVINPP